MKVKHGTVVLADFGREAPSNLQISTNQLVEVVEYFRAEDIAILDRGVIRNEISFSVSRLHATEQAAKIFILDHAAQITGVKVLTIEIRGTGGIISRRFIEESMVTPNASHIGCSSLFQYRILGGKFLTIMPV